MNQEQEYWDWVAEMRFKKENEEGHFTISGNFPKYQHMVRILFDAKFKDHFIDSRILDIGCGVSFVAGSLAAVYMFKSYLGIDISDWIVKANSSLFALKSMVSNIDDLSQFRDKEFNWIFAFDVLEHIEVQKRQKLYLEINRILDDDASIAINIPKVGNSGHDSHFDYGYTLHDALELAETCSMQIGYVERFSTIKNSYHFVVMDRRNP